MSQLRWSPFRDLEYVLDRYHRAYALPAQAQQGDGSRELITRADWVPAVDITETDAEYRVQAELPAVQKENVKVSVDKGVLNISGERRLEKDESGATRHRRVERVFGSFSRSFTLPDNVDETAISAEYKDGVLSLRIPKVAKAQPRAIDIQVH